MAKSAWTEVNVATLPAKTAALYKAYKDALAKFDAALTADLGKSVSLSDGQVIRVGHGFGKVSFTVTDAAASRTPFSFK